MNDFAILDIKTNKFHQLTECLLMNPFIIDIRQDSILKYRFLSSDRRNLFTPHEGDNILEYSQSLIAFPRNNINHTSRSLYDLNDDKPNLQSYKSEQLIPYSLVQQLIESEAIQIIQDERIKIGIFDTGLHIKHPHFHNIIEQIDWTTDKTNNDYIGHGTFIAGIISSNYSKCKGISQYSDLFIFRIFDKYQLSYTSWFLDAFNYVLHRHLDIINLSIGGTDHSDEPFKDKINELAANGVIIVSAIGNSGPVWGGASSPGDQVDVLGVGGWHSGDRVSSFSSRGMTTSELALSLSLSQGGFGRVKPDILAPSIDIFSSSSSSPTSGSYGCRLLSGTSVATPVVTGAIALLLSSVPREKWKRHNVRNIAAIKQILMSSAHRLSGPSIFEQGAGLLNITAANGLIQTHRPHVSVFPSRISNLPEDCPYLRPWCTQRIFHTSQPLLANISILNSMGVIGYITKIEWNEEYDQTSRSRSRNRNSKNDFKVHIDMPIQGVKEPRSSTSSSSSSSSSTYKVIELQGGVLDVKLDVNTLLWPWSGAMGIAIRVSPHQQKEFTGVVKGSLIITVDSSRHRSRHVDPRDDVSASESASDLMSASVPRIGQVALSVDVRVESRLPRSKRVLWDVFHGMSYPSAFVPRDDLSDDRDLFDSLGDHPFTNYLMAYEQLQELGYTVDILRSPWTCFDARHYSILIISDPEETFHPNEVNKLENDMRYNNLSVLIIGDWYDEQLLREASFMDDNTQSMWYPITGGANMHAINSLINRFDASLGMQAFSGRFTVGDAASSSSSQVSFKTGNTLSRWPRGGALLVTGPGELSPVKAVGLRASARPLQAVGGYLRVTSQSESGNRSATSSGRLVVFGDSHCMESDSGSHSHSHSHNSNPSGRSEGCRRLLEHFLHYLSTGRLVSTKDTKSTLWPQIRILKSNYESEPSRRQQQNYDMKDFDSVYKEDRAVRLKEYSRYSKFMKPFQTELIELSTEMCSSVF
eukprot:gene3854-7686_t